ncbi:MAG TPA: hypothetical protein VGM30_13040 [Puia sp.]
MKRHFIRSKYFMISFIAMVSFSSCGMGQSDAKKTAEQIRDAVKTNSPGSLATSDGGWMMRAKIDGKEWMAESMMPTEPTGRILGKKGDITISFPYSRRDMTAGRKIRFGQSWAVDLFTGGDIRIWGGYKGEMVITKVDGQWAEGTFFFTGTTTDSPDKKVEVTDGFFRISLTKP